MLESEIVKPAEALEMPKNNKLHTAVYAIGLFAMSLPMATTSWSSEPGYDCSKAQGQIQELICTDDDLAQLDRQLTEVYAAALETMPKDQLSSLKAEQRGWIKGRDECWKAEDKNACVTMEYQARTVQLQITSGQLMAPTAVSYECAGDNQLPLSTVYYTETMPPSAVLTRGQDQVIAFVAPSGSGARYVTEDVEFWEHQGEAVLSWFGTEFSCKVVK